MHVLALLTCTTDSIGLHRMANEEHTEGAVSLHIYSPPYKARPHPHWHRPAAAIACLIQRHSITVTAV